MKIILEINKIYNEDCLEGMKKINDKSIDMVTTDPPYGIKLKSSWSDKFACIENDDNLDWCENLFYELNRVTKDNSHLYCFTGLDCLPQFILNIQKYWKVQNLLTIPRTQKGGAGSKTQSFSYQNEFVIFATKGNKKFNETKILKPSECYLKDKRKHPKEYLYRLPDYWYWLKASEFNLSRLHPTQKTISCVQTMIELSSNVGDIILDPFMGSGTTGRACINTQRNFIGFETDTTYCGLANKRILDIDK